jgi:hypothetical protein
MSRLSPLERGEIDAEIDSIDRLRCMFIDAVDAADHDKMQYIDEDCEALMYDSNCEVSCAAICSLTYDQVLTILEYAEQRKSLIVHWFAYAFYLAKNADMFMLVMLWLDDDGKRRAMGTITSSDLTFDAENEAFRFFTFLYPQHASSQEWFRGGLVALRQCCQPEPYSDYSMTRNEAYRNAQTDLKRANRLERITNEGVTIIA